MFSNFEHFFYLFSNKILLIRAGNRKMFLKIANREDPDLTTSPEAIWSESALFA